MDPGLPYRYTSIRLYLYHLIPINTYYFLSIRINTYKFQLIPIKFKGILRVLVRVLMAQIFLKRDTRIGSIRRIRYASIRVSKSFGAVSCNYAD